MLGLADEHDRGLWDEMSCYMLRCMLMCVCVCVCVCVLRCNVEWAFNMCERPGNWVLSKKRFWCF